MHPPIPNSLLKIDHFSKTQRPCQNWKGNDRDQPAEKSNDETKAHIICFDLFDLAMPNDQDHSKGGNAHHYNRPPQDQPFKEIRQARPLDYWNNGILEQWNNGKSWNNENKNRN